MHAEGIAVGLRAVAAEDGRADARHVCRLRQVVTGAAFPYEHVVGEVARERMRLRFGRGEAQSHQRDVLVVPRVAVGERHPLRHA